MTCARVLHCHSHQAVSITCIAEIMDLEYKQILWTGSARHRPLHQISMVAVKTLQNN